jgi:hypothetical protein
MFDDLFRVAEDHHGFVHVEQLRPGRQPAAIERLLTITFCPCGLQNRHAVNGAS